MPVHLCAEVKPSGALDVADVLVCRTYGTGTVCMGGMDCSATRACKYHCKLQLWQCVAMQLRGRRMVLLSRHWRQTKAVRVAKRMLPANPVNGGIWSLRAQVASCQVGGGAVQVPCLGSCMLAVKCQRDEGPLALRASAPRLR